MIVCEAVGEEEEDVCLGEFVQAGEVEGVDGKVVFVRFEDGRGEGEGFLEAALGEEEIGFCEEEVRVLGKVVVRGEGFGGVGEFGGVLVLGEAGGVEHFGKLSRFLGGRGVVGGDGVEVKGFEKGPFFVGGHEGIFHQLVEGFEALNVYSDGVFVAFLGSVEGVLLCKADASQVAHRGFELEI